MSSVNSLKPSKAIEEIEINDEVASSLDRNFVTAGQCSKLLSTLVTTVGLKKKGISKSTIRRKIRSSRKIAALQKFDKLGQVPSFLQVHFDGKTFPVRNAQIRSSNGSKEEYIAIVGSFGDFEEILGTKIVTAATANEIKEVVFDSMEHYDILEKIVALGFDTTNVNAGKLKHDSIRF